MAPQGRGPPLIPGGKKASFPPYVLVFFGFNKAPAVLKKLHKDENIIMHEKKRDKKRKAFSTRKHALSSQLSVLGLQRVDALKQATYTALNLAIQGVPLNDLTVQMADLLFQQALLHIPAGNAAHHDV